MSPDVMYSGNWRARPDPGAPALATGRYAWYSRKCGDAVDFSFTGSTASFLYRPGAPCAIWGIIERDAARTAGCVEAYVDGRPAGTFDLQRGDCATVATNLPSARHVLRLVNRGRDGKDARVAIRGFRTDGRARPPRNVFAEDPELRDEAARLPPIAFFTGAPYKSGAVPNAVWQSSPISNRWGCALKIYDPRKPALGAKTVFAEPDSLIYDLALSPDATRILFSMKRHRARTWQIYEIGTDGRNLRAVTSEPGVHYASPAYLPDGRIACVSSRTPGYHTVCQPGPSTHVYVIGADGSNPRRLSSNTLSDFNLTTLSDGRLLFTRWEYVDWNLTYRQSLWTQYPDGRQLSLWFGNLSVDPASFVQAMEIPGGYGAVCTFAAHHGSVYGAIGSLSPRLGPEETPGEDTMRVWTPEYPCIYDASPSRACWSWPMPLSDSRALASFGEKIDGRHRIMLLASDGRRATVYADPESSCFRAWPVVARPAPRMLADFTPTVTNHYTLEAAPPGQPQRERVPLGRILVSDVYRGLDGSVPRGTVACVRVMEQLPKTVNRTWNGVLDQGPLLSASTYYAKRVWSYAPVAADGSAFFEAPALKEIHLQLVDAEGRELKRMTSAINLMPGETQSCTGCHENRRTAALPLPAEAARRAPSPISPPEWGNAGVLDYVRVVQPVWDRWCVRCHGGTTPPKGLSLAGGYTRFFNRSYDSLVLRSKSDAKSRAYYTGASKEKPLVQGLHLLYGVTEPYDVRESGSFASRLPDYLEKRHCGAEIPAGDKRRVYEWIDAQLPYYATSDHAHVGGKSGRDRWGVAEGTCLQPWFTARFMPIYTNSCASCHGAINLKPNLTNVIEPSWWWFDLSHPHESPVLWAHLPKAAGGCGCGKFSFAGKDDPIRRKLRDIAAEAAEAAWQTPEADMPGFVPRSRGRAEYHP